MPFTWKPAPIVLCCLSLMVSGCAALPSDGPATSSIVRRDTSGDTRTHIIDITTDNAGVISPAPTHLGLKSLETPVTENALLIGAGDVVTLSFTGAEDMGGSSSVAPKSVSPMAPIKEEVSPDGTISVPFSGRAYIAGLSGTAASRRVSRAMSSVTTALDVTVAVSKHNHNIVYVSGDVRKPGGIVLGPVPARVGDIIGEAGGVVRDIHDASAAYTVTVLREGQAAQADLSTVMGGLDDILLQGGDRVRVSLNASHYNVLGATGKVAEFPFNASNLSLMTALARAGGLADGRANPKGVFVFRQKSDGRFIYHFDMTNPSTFFAAETFSLRDRDILYVSDAPTTQIYKMFSLIGTLAAPAMTAGWMAK